MTIHTIGEFDEPEPVPDLEDTLQRVLGYPTTISNPVENLTDAFTEGYAALKADLEEGKRIWVNAAGITDARGIAVLFAANTLQHEQPELRESIQVYTTGDDGPQFLPMTPSQDPTDVGLSILEYLTENGPPESITDLAKKIATGEEGDAFRTTVQYNVIHLEEAGLVTREGSGRSTRPQLTSTGEAWVKSHL